MLLLPITAAAKQEVKQYDAPVANIMPPDASVERGHRVGSYGVLAGMPPKLVKMTLKHQWKAPNIKPSEKHFMEDPEWKKYSPTYTDKISMKNSRPDYVETFEGQFSKPGSGNQLLGYTHYRKFGGKEYPQYKHVLEKLELRHGKPSYKRGRNIGYIFSDKEKVTVRNNNSKAPEYQIAKECWGHLKQYEQSRNEIPEVDSPDNVSCDYIQSYEFKTGKLKNGSRVITSVTTRTLDMNRAAHAQQNDKLSGKMLQDHVRADYEQAKMMHNIKRKGYLKFRERLKRKAKRRR